jgi:hypothetical protein
MVREKDGEGGGILEVITKLFYDRKVSERYHIDTNIDTNLFKLNELSFMLTDFMMQLFCIVFLITTTTNFMMQLFCIVFLIKTTTKPLIPNKLGYARNEKPIGKHKIKDPNLCSIFIIQFKCH